MSLNQTLRFILGHPLNRGRPISTLARFAKWQIQSRIQEEIIVEWVDGAKLAIRRGMKGATGNVYCGLHEYTDMRFVLDTLKPGDLFADIGANVGSYTVLASKVCAAQTIAVEPDPNTLTALRRNIEVNAIRDRVRVVEAALGAQNGRISFTMGLDTLNRVADANDKNIRDVPITTLDEVLNGAIPKVIKIDVEGFEAEVLKGAAATLADRRLSAVITETLDEEVLDILISAGFSRAYYDPQAQSMRSHPVFPSSNSILVR